MKKKLHFWVILLLAFLLLLPLTVPALGEKQSSLNPDLRWLALYSGAYIVSHSYDGPTPFGEAESPDWWKGQETKAKALSDQEFNLFLRENLLSAISRFDKGEGICWNKDFVQTMVKEDFPDLYQKIESQINTQDKREYNYLPTGIAQLNYTPGSRTRTFDAIMYNVFGMPVWGFFCRIYWVWNSTSITSILPSSWGEAYAPLWTFDGIIGNQQNWIYPYWHWHKWVKGQFTLWAIPYVVPITHNYPWLDIYISAGGNSYYSFGL